MIIRVLFFASLADALGVREAALELPDNADVARAIGALTAEYPKLADSSGRLAFAVNRAYVGRSAPLADGDELALIPPVSGG
jgi:molybdopterin synthase catalytic subunit